MARVTAAAQPPPDGPTAPPAEPQAIRACLSSSLKAEFDREWESALDEAKHTKTLALVHDVLNKWRHTAFMEMRDPGSYYRMLGKAEQIMRTGTNPDAVPFEDMMALIEQRLGR